MLFILLLFIFCVCAFVCVCFVCMWYILNYIAKRELRRSLQLEGYFERFNDTDKQIRNNMTLDEYVASCRILYPNEYFKLWKLRKYNFVNHKVLIFSKRFEGGFPHTHGRFIMAPSIEVILIPRIYVHEQVHIYQRYHPLEVNAFLTKLYPIKSIATTRDNFRSNPDTNMIIYDNVTSKYKDNAKSLNDISDRNDHPYELMAYNLEEKILNLKNNNE